MAFLTQDDFNDVIRDYQLEAITDNDITIVPKAIRKALTEITNIFTPNNMKKWQDGRPIYDIAAVLAKTDDDRDDLILAYAQIITLWHLVILCNTGLEYAEIKDRYDRAKADLLDLADGTTNSPTMPQITTVPPDTQLPFESGSHRKFRHNY